MPRHMSYEPPRYDSVSPGISDDPYLPPEYDNVDFGSAAGLTIAAPKTTINTTHLQSVLSGAGRIAVNMPKTDLSLAGELATPTGAGPVALDTDVTNISQTPFNPLITTPRAENTPRTGEWLVEIIHPETGRLITPDVLDEPQLTPSINGYAEIRVPVRRDPEWLTPAFDDDPEMTVYFDGVEQPIDELREVEQTPERSVLNGRGGVELETIVNESFDAERRHLAAEQLITENTSYTADVDAPDTTTREDQRVADWSTAIELDENSRTLPTDPVFFDNGNAILAQVCFNQTVSDIQADGDFNVTQVQTGATGNVEGKNFIIEDVNSHYVEFPVDLNYDIAPEGFEQLGIGGLETRFHAELFGASGAFRSATFRLDIDGSDSGVRITFNEDDEIEWSGINPDMTLEDGLSAGEYTFRFTLIDLTDADGVILDNIACYDDRFGGDLDFPDTVDSNNQLAGPQLYPESYLLEFPEDFTTPFAFTAADVFASMNTSNNQYVEASFDRGQTFTRASNSESLTVSQPSGSPTLRIQVNMSRHGSRTNETPTEGYLGQEIEFIIVDADIELALLLINEDFESDLATVLNDIATENEFIWSYRLVDGEPTLTFTQPGARVAGRDPDIGDVMVDKESTVYPRVRIKGSPQPVSGEQFTGDTSFEPLNRSPILSGSESVTDPDTSQQFDEFVDYEINREAGEIRITDGGDMSEGDTYEINYRFEIRGEFTADDAPADPRTLVREVPGVTSERQARQIALLLVREFDVPSYGVDLSVPREDIDFDVVEAFTLENLDVPPVATPLEVRGEPVQTPRGLAVRLGSRPEIEAEIAQIADQLRAVSERS